jgi:hypothetical protein
LQRDEAYPDTLEDQYNFYQEELPFRIEKSCMRRSFKRVVFVSRNLIDAKYIIDTADQAE